MHGTNELDHVESLAKDEAVPANYLAQILSELRDGGLINSRRGKQGGYTLARSPEEISLYDIVKLVEGEVLELTTDSKGQSARRVEQIWRDVRGAFEDKLRSYSLDQLAARNTDEMYYI